MVELFGLTNLNNVEESNRTYFTEFFQNAGRSQKGEKISGPGFETETPSQKTSMQTTES